MNTLLWKESQFDEMLQSDSKILINFWLGGAARLAEIYKWGGSAGRRRSL